VEPHAPFHASLYAGLCNYGSLDLSVIRDFLGSCHSNILQQDVLHKIDEAGIGVAESLIWSLGLVICTVRGPLHLPPSAFFALRFSCKCGEEEEEDTT
jgi:hypothetical protein